MANPSRTEFPDYVEKPVMCERCGTRVILKDKWVCYFDVAANHGWVRHIDCTQRRAKR